MSKGGQPPQSFPNAAFPYGTPPSVRPVGALKDNKRKLTAQRLNPSKCANPFQSNLKACKSAFSQSYISGSIPCRLLSSSAKQWLQWEPHAKSGFSADLLAVCAEGLIETEHPYTVLATMMFSELVLRAEGVIEMFVPVIEPICASLRRALLVKECCPAALNALKLLLGHTGNLLAPQLPKLVPCLARLAHDRDLKNTAFEILGMMEQQCGPAAAKLIKSKIPTY